jgi:predicted nucleic acid-binding protein
VLADTSAWIWSRRAPPAVRNAFDEAVVDGRIATCDTVRLELLYSARNATDFRELETELAELPDCPISKAEWRAALDVYRALADAGGAHQRAVKHADLLIAAAARAAGHEVLHYDEDFDRIAGVTGQRCRWLAPRGTL